MGKEYNMNLTKRYKVAFVKDGAVYKSGDVVEVNMPTAANFFSDGKIEIPSELMSDAKKLGCEELFQSKRSKNSAV